MNGNVNKTANIDVLDNNGSINSVFLNIGSVNPLGSGITTDPVNQHLYVGSSSGILDITPSTKNVRTVNTQTGDGITVSPDGTTVYLAQMRTINGYDTTTGVKVFSSGAIFPGIADGVGVIQGSGQFTGDLVVNTNGGIAYLLNPVTKALTDIADGGSRGDFVGVDLTNGSLFLTQTSSVDRLTCGSGCFFGTATINFPGGGPSNPVLLPSHTPVGQINSIIDGNGSADFYEFLWPADGNFQAQASISGANPNGLYEFGLFNLSGTVIQEFALDAADSFSASITQFLLTDDYIIGILADSPNDPMFTITFNTPVEGVPVPTPEPSSFTLLAFGLFAYGFIWRSKQAVGNRSHRAVRH